MAEAVMASLPKELPQPTMVDFLMGDHLDFVILARHFQKAAAAGDAQAQETLADALEVITRLHSQAELDVLYPFVRKTLGSAGEALIDTSLEEHAAVESSAAKMLSQRKDADEKLKATVESLLADFTEHLMKEEDEIMTKVLGKASAADLADVALKFQVAKEGAPLDRQPTAAAEKKEEKEAGEEEKEEGEEEA